MKRTLKDIYNWDYIENPETSLLKHINKVLSKTPDELSSDDICMLVRQECFLDLVIPKAIELITKDHSVGDYYDYCLLCSLSKMESSLVDYKELIIGLINVLEKDFASINFELDDDKNDYLSSIERLKNKI